MGRLLHHIAGFAGDREVAFTGHGRYLDGKQLPADLGDAQPDRQSNLIFAKMEILPEASWSQIVGEPRVGEPHAIALAAKMISISRCTADGSFARSRTFS